MKNSFTKKLRFLVVAVATSALAYTGLVSTPATAAPAVVITPTNFSIARSGGGNQFSYEAGLVHRGSMYMYLDCAWLTANAGATVTVTGSVTHSAGATTSSLVGTSQVNQMGPSFGAYVNYNMTPITVTNGSFTVPACVSNLSLNYNDTFGFTPTTTGDDGTMVYTVRANGGPNNLNNVLLFDENTPTANGVGNAYLSVSVRYVSNAAFYPQGYPVNSPVPSSFNIRSRDQFVWAYANACIASGLAAGTVIAPVISTSPAQVINSMGGSQNQDFYPNGMQGMSSWGATYTITGNETDLRVRLRMEIQKTYYDQNSQMQTQLGVGTYSYEFDVVNQSNNQSVLVTCPVAQQNNNQQQQQQQPQSPAQDWKPVVKNVSHKKFGARGGDKILVEGNLVGLAEKVSVGGVETTNFTVINANTIELTIPAAAAAASTDIVVFTKFGNATYTGIEILDYKMNAGPSFKLADKRTFAVGTAAEFVGHKSQTLNWYLCKKPVSAGTGSELPANCSREWFSTTTRIPAGEDANLTWSLVRKQNRGKHLVLVTVATDKAGNKITAWSDSQKI